MGPSIATAVMGGPVALAMLLLVGPIAGCMDLDNDHETPYVQLPIYAANASWRAGESWTWASEETGQTLTMTILAVGDHPFPSGGYLVVYDGSSAPEPFLSFVRRSGLEVTETDLDIVCHAPCDGDWENQIDVDGSDSQGFLFMPFPLREDSPLANPQPVGRPWVDGQRIRLEHRVESGILEEIMTGMGVLEALPIFHNYTIGYSADNQVSNFEEKRPGDSSDLALHGHWSKQVDSFARFEALPSSSDLWVHDYGSFLNVPWIHTGPFVIQRHEFLEPLTPQEIVERYGTIEAEPEEEQETTKGFTIHALMSDQTGYPANLSVDLVPPTNASVIEVGIAHQAMGHRDDTSINPASTQTPGPITVGFAAPAPGEYRITASAHVDDGAVLHAATTLFVGPDAKVDLTCSAGASLDSPCGRAAIPLAPGVEVVIEGTTSGLSSSTEIDLLDAAGQLVASTTVEDGSFSLRADARGHDATSDWTLLVSSTVHGDLELDATARYAPATTAS